MVRGEQKTRAAKRNIPTKVHPTTRRKAKGEKNLFLVCKVVDKAAIQIRAR